MAFRKRPIATGIATLLFSGYLSALGLGEIQLNSTLNEPLDAEIPLLNLGELTEEELIAGLASTADFAKAGVDKELILNTLVFQLDTDASGGPVLRVLSKKPIREPYLDFLVDVQWPSGRLLREYTLLMDLPVHAGGASKKKVEQPVVGRGQAPARQQASRQPARSTPPRPEIEPGDEQYEVQRGDTLWGIASSLQSDASIHRRMDAIMQLNPDAFIDGNRNLVKRGAVLRLPDYGTMDAGVSGRESAADSSYTPELSGSGRRTGPSAPAESSGRLTLEAGDGSGTGGSSMGSGAGSRSGLRGEIATLQEELDRSHRENSELKQRLSSLEEQITTMQRLMEISDDDLRAIQLSQSADGIADQIAGDVLESEDPTAATSPEADGEEDSPALALFPSAGDSARRQQAAQVAQRETAAGETDVGEMAPAADQDEPEQQEVAQQAEEAESATPSIKMDSKNKEEGWFDKVNGFLLALLGIFVIIAGAVVAYVLRKRKVSEEEYQPPAEPRVSRPAPVREQPRETVPPPPPPSEPRADSIDDINLKEGDDLFEEPTGAAPEPVPQEPAEPESLEDMELDLSEFDLDETEQPRETVEFEESSEAEPVSGDELNLDEEFDFLGDIDEGDTQLELAQAYLEMGDQSGAREILREVAEGGSDEQKQKARQLLDQLG